MNWSTKVLSDSVYRNIFFIASLELTLLCMHGLMNVHMSQYYIPERKLTLAHAPWLFYSTILFAIILLVISVLKQGLV